MRDAGTAVLPADKKGKPIAMRKARYWMMFLIAAAGASAQTPRAIPMIDATTANLPAEKIGPNDLIAISVYDAPEFTRTVRVGGDGLIRLPMLKGAVRAAGRMPSELQQAVADALAAAKLIVDPLVTVTVVEYKSRPVSVMGAVRKPVTFQASGDVNLLEALARAEGLGPDAGPEILVSKAGDADALVRRISVKDLLSGSDPSLNLKLAGGEQIRVPEAGKIFVVGNVRKPGAFSMGIESSATILKAVAMAEGLTPFAAKKAVIYRREAAGSGVNEIPIELGKIMDRKLSDSPLLINDVLYVPDSKGKRAGWTTVERLLMFGSGATTALIYGAATR